MRGSPLPFFRGTEEGRGCDTEWCEQQEQMALSYEGVCDDYDHGVNDLMKMQIGRIVRPVYLGRTKPSQQATSQKDATRQDRMEPREEQPPYSGDSTLHHTQCYLAISSW